MTAERLADRRFRQRRPRVVYEADTARLVLTLPDHRLRPGATIAYTGLDGAPRTATLPWDAAPGATVRVASEESYAWPRVIELVLLPSD